MPYLEALRQIRQEFGKNNSLVIHLTLIPYLAAAGELKTKPTQHSVKELLKTGIQPDILVCRTEYKLTKDLRSKLSLFCNVEKNSVIEALDAKTIYDVPMYMLKENLDAIVLKKLKLKKGKEPELVAWKEFLGRLKNPTSEVRIGLIGKYNELPDAYKSIHEAFVHSGAANECKVSVIPIHSEELESSEIKSQLQALDGILVAPGFGERGIRGKIKAIKYARQNNIPFFGICLGMQCAVVEVFKNVAKLPGAMSSEINPKAKNLVVDLMPEQLKIKNKGGTMRLGSYKCKIKKGSIAAKAYGKLEISERHRHRYEFNNKYLKRLEKTGMIATGINPETNLVEIVEIPEHEFFIGVQYHPELKSTVENPHPLFISFIKAAMKHRARNEKA